MVFSTYDDGRFPIMNPEDGYEKILLALMLASFVLMVTFSSNKNFEHLASDHKDCFENESYTYPCFSRSSFCIAHFLPSASSPQFDYSITTNLTGTFAIQRMLSWGGLRPSRGPVL